MTYGTLEASSMHIDKRLRVRLKILVARVSSEGSISQQETKGVMNRRFYALKV